MARQFLDNVYGDEVLVEYYDAAIPEEAAMFPELIKEAGERHIAYPLVLVNGELRVSGGVDTYQLMFIVDEDRRQKGLPTKF